ncbi:MAG TPA: M14 family metallopeptidase [Fimbriimonadales bacterium]|nr:M14 family metallopeptidase [Fimbriimonadales bacterium]
MPDISFHRYYRYEELTSLLRAYSQEFPTLVGLESIGKSFEGRDIWLVTVTDNSTGSHENKPAFWCDGNIHASEVSPSTAVLYLLHTLVTQFEKDEQITHALKTRTFYLVPRVNPDGAEWALADKPKIIRSSTRPYPYDEEDPYGLEREDIDGDGRILSMRIEDPNGAWKISEEEPRLMVRREPSETGGKYYRMMPEGRFYNFDPLRLRGRKIKEGLDLNRNFPSGWRLEYEQVGAGPYPTSEPEVRAIVQAITNRPNICGAVTFHTYSGVHLRPPSRMPDEDIPAEDLWNYQKIGDKGKELTGYPAISNYHEFRYHPKEVITGVFDDWMYEHRGVFAWTTEIWSPQREAGITDYKYIEWFREHPFEHDKMLLKWSDEKLGGKGYVDWYEFEHPQLGKVELGGWDGLYAWRNPPPEYLEREVARFPKWIVWQALLSPQLKTHRVELLRNGESTVIRFAVDNIGWLPTYITKIGLNRKLCRGVVGEIELPENMKLLSGLLREEGPQLEGRSHIPASTFGWIFQETDHRHVFEWSVKGKGRVKLTARHDRAGVVTETVEV